MFGTIQSYFRLRYGRDKAYYRMLKTIFGLRPNNIELYKLALIHRSASLFLDDGAPINNERLEFLGDAVIESIVSDFLFIEFPEADEGFLSRLRSRIVRRSSLNRLAIEIGLDRYVIAQGGNGFAQNDLKHTTGVLSMARAMHPDSAGSQFFIMVAPAPHLDGQYAAFGQVTGNVEEAIRISEVPTDWNDKPKTPVVIQSIRVDTQGVDYSRKADFRWISLIRLPEFVTKEAFDWAIREDTEKKQRDFSKVEFFSWEEGLCVQCMHIGPYDDEPTIVAAMDECARFQGCELDFSQGRFHHEIYLSDIRRTKPEKLKTVIRQPIKRAE